MPSALKRVSLPRQAANAIRKDIEAHTWNEFLPSERRLCDLFQISRPTVRTALQLLAKDGLIEARKGNRKRVILPGPSARKVQSRLVAIVAEDPASVGNAPINEMRTKLAREGFITDCFFYRPGDAKAQCRRIELFARQNGVAAWLLHSPSLELQRWFGANSLPTLVLGSCYPAVRLPSLDIDNRSVCRHAAGVLMGKGHRRIVFISPVSKGAGARESEAGFLEAFKRRSQDSKDAVVIGVGDLAHQLSAKLDPLFNSAHPPTALVVARPQQVFNVIYYLLKRGLSLPEDVSLIARDEHDYLPNFSPQIAHYSGTQRMLGRRLPQLMLQMLQQGYLPAMTHWVFPRLFAGGTIKKLAEPVALRPAGKRL